MLSLQPVERVEALLDRLEPPRLGLDPVEVGAQVAAGVVELDRRRAQALGDRVELGVDPGRGDEAGVGRGKRGARAAAVVVGAADRGERARRAGAQALGVSQQPALGVELGLLLGARRRRLDLGELEAHQVEVALADALALAQLGELAGETADLGVSRAIVRAQLAELRSPPNPSRISSWAEARVSLRCSCWP